MSMPSPLSCETLLKTAIAAAEAGAAHAVNQRSRNQEANLISSRDIKLKLDIECQQIITKTILHDFPDHTILGEEDAEHEKSRPDVYEWVIDPIDGTVNFFHGSPYWCSSVAVRLNGQTLAGCVSAPDMSMRFEATVNGPALRNGTEIHVSDIADLPTSIVHMGADKSAPPGREPLRFFNAIAPRIQRSRICGAAALDICLLAAGAAEGYFEGGIYIWDVAAADLILRRAGGQGTFVRRFADERIAYLGSNGLVHEALHEIIEAVF